MRIWNAKTPDVAAMLMPWYVPTETENRMQIANNLYERLKNKPDDTFFAVAIENNIARAVLIAHVSDEKKNTVWAYQARTQSGFKDGPSMFEQLKAWAREKGCRRIETGITDERVVKVLQRRYGFKRKGQEIYCEL